jgi:hypothetical protein
MVREALETVLKNTIANSRDARVTAVIVWLSSCGASWTVEVSYNGSVVPPED